MTIALQGVGIRSAGVVPSVGPITRVPRAAVVDHGTDNGVSLRAQFLSALASIAQTDPARAKQMLTDLAGMISHRASAMGGAREGQLNALAEKILKAAESGDYSTLMQETSGSTSMSSTAAARYGQASAVTASSR